MQYQRFMNGTTIIFIVPFFLVMTLAGCNSGGNEPEPGETVHAQATDTIVRGARPIRLDGCYQMILKKDTATLVLEVRDSTVTGNLNYHWNEKDWNEGSLKGVLRNDAIHADYTFQSEGMTSVREVVFRIEENGYLVEGFGDLLQKDGKVVFADRDALQYQQNHPFIPVPCNNNR